MLLTRSESQHDVSKYSWFLVTSSAMVSAGKLSFLISSENLINHKCVGTDVTVIIGELKWNTKIPYYPRTSQLVVSSAIADSRKPRSFCFKILKCTGPHNVSGQSHLGVVAQIEGI